MSNSPFLYFDIETGDLKADKSPVLSISYARGSEVKSFYANPPAGSFISKWARENVWEPIRQRLGGDPVESEESVLRSFLGVLEGHRGGTIAGWNIGYVPTPQAPGVKGLDIPFLMSRAEKYGLSEQYQKAFEGVSVRDIGREYSVRIAQEVVQHRGLVDPDLFAQAESFSKLININSGMQRLHSVPEQARWMGTPGKYGGYEVAGWKLKNVYSYLFGESLEGHHLSEADVLATQRIAEMGDPGKLKGSAFASLWSQTALANKAEASARAALYSEGIEGNFVGRATARGETRAWGSTFFRNAGRIALEHRLGLGVALGIGALAMTKPLSLFSGKDDEYNTIEGLPHGGQAERMRRMHTEFGSGWVGSRAWNLTRTLWNESNREIAHIMKHMVVPGLKRGGPLELGVVGASMYEVGSTVASAVGSNLTLGGATASLASMAIGKYVYAGIKKRKEIAAYAKIAIETPDEAKFITKTAAKGIWKQAKDYLFHGVENELAVFSEMGGGDLGRQAVLGHLEGKFGVRIPGRDDAWNLIEGLRHGGLAEELRKRMTDFGSGWMRRAFSAGVGMEKIGLAAEIAGKSPEFAKRVMSTIGKDAQFTVMGGEKWLTMKRLGEGGFGTADLVMGASSGRMGVLKTSTRTEPLEAGTSISGPLVNRPFFKSQHLMREGKTPLQRYRARQRLSATTRFLDKYMGAVRKTSETAGEIGSITYEVAMQKLARKELGDIVPEVYAQGENQFIQEYAGRSLQSIVEKGGVGASTSAQEGLEFMERTFGKMYGKKTGIAHFDPSLGNITKRGNRYMIIDWGVAAPVTEQHRYGKTLISSLKKSYVPEIEEGIAAAAEDSISTGRFKVSPAMSAPTPPVAPAGAGGTMILGNAEKKIHQSQLQRMASKQMSENTVRAGKGHRTYTTTRGGNR